MARWSIGARTELRSAPRDLGPHYRDRRLTAQTPRRVHASRSRPAVHPRRREAASRQRDACRTPPSRLLAGARGSSGRGKGRHEPLVRLHDPRRRTCGEKRKAGQRCPAFSMVSSRPVPGETQAKKLTSAPRWRPGRSASCRPAPRASCACRPSASRARPGASSAAPRAPSGRPPGRRRLGRSR